MKWILLIVAFALIIFAATLLDDYNVLFTPYNAIRFVSGILGGLFILLLVKACDDGN